MNNKTLIKENIELYIFPERTGNSAIIDYVTDTSRRHEHIYNLVSEYIVKNSEEKIFSDLYSAIKKIADGMIRKSAKITLPGSTLVFPHFYLLK